MIEKWTLEGKEFDRKMMKVERKSSHARWEIFFFFGWKMIFIQKKLEKVHPVDKKNIITC